MKLTPLIPCLLAMFWGSQLAAAPAGIIAEGKPWETKWYLNDSGVDGPVVMIVGGVHGEELAGSAAAEQIRCWSVCRGKLIVLPRANAAAVQAGRRVAPNTPIPEQNLNRNFPMPRDPGPPRGELATAIWEFTQKQNPAWLIDLHEGGDFNQTNNRSVGSSLIVFPTPEGKTAAASMLAAVNSSVTNLTLQFKQLESPVDGSLARAAGVHLHAHTMILETTMKNQALSYRTRQHRIMVHALLKHLGMVDEKTTPECMAPLDTPKAKRIAIYDAEGTIGACVRQLTQILGEQDRFRTSCIGPEDIRLGALGQFGCVIFPGGGATTEAAPLAEAGRDQVQRFVRDGGGYIGICAGAFLATSGYPWSFGLLSAKTASPKWQRGRGLVKIELTDKGREILGNQSGLLEIRYVNGPIICPAEVPTLAPYEPLALFRTELSEHDTPQGLMLNSPAIVSGNYGRGRVVSMSPHPELTKGLESFVINAVSWVAR